MRSAVGSAPTPAGPARAEGAGGPAAAGVVASSITDGDLTSQIDWSLGYWITSNKKLLGAKGIATSNKGLTSSNKKLLETIRSDHLMSLVTFSMVFFHVFSRTVLEPDCCL